MTRDEKIHPRLLLKRSHVNDESMKTTFFFYFSSSVHRVAALKNFCGKVLWVLTCAVLLLPVLLQMEEETRVFD